MEYLILAGGNDNINTSACDSNVCFGPSFCPSHCPILALKCSLARAGDISTSIPSLEE